MSGRPKAPVFLERATYRQRRLRDAARVLPLLGVVLCSIPLLWPNGNTAGSRSSDAVIYFFAVWVILIALSAMIARVLRSDEGEDQT